MSDDVADAEVADSEQESLSPRSEPATRDGTNVGRYLATRGQILVKEFHSVHCLRCEYGYRLTIDTLVLSAAKANSQWAKTYGVRLVSSDSDGDSSGVAFIDFEELDPLVAACGFISHIAERFASEQREYTEVQFTSRDGVCLGFYQEHASQTVFIKLGGGAESLFISPQKFSVLQGALEAARKHLVEYGAT